MLARSIEGRAGTHSPLAHHFPQLEQLIIELSMLSDRYREFRAAAFMIVVASLIAGCATSAREQPISYVPQESVHPVKDADAIAVEVRVEDLQAPPSDSIWNSIDPIKQTNYSRVKNPVDTLKAAAETELKARGFKIGNAGALVVIQLGRFEAVVESDMSGIHASGSLSMRVQVQPQSGKALYSKVVRGEGAPTTAYFYLDKCFSRELEGSLEDAFKRLFDDPAFTAAILATSQPAPAKPVSPGRIAGAFATMSRR